MGIEIDFLAVGEESQSGDAILVRVGDLYGPRSGQTVILIDGGFRDTADAVLDHLRTHYGTTHIDLMVSTHPDSDHINGLRELVDRAAKDVDQLTIGELWLHRPSRWQKAIERSLKKVADHPYADAVKRTLQGAADLEEAASRLGIPIREPFTGLAYGDGMIQVVGPTEDFYQSLFEEESATSREESRLLRWLGALREMVTAIAEDWDVETLGDGGVTSPINNSSAVIMVRVDEEFALFTGDAGTPALHLAADILQAAGYHEQHMRFIQVPHHGSRRNVGPTVLDRLLGPRRAEDDSTRTAYVSAARAGAPKHPAKKVTNAFRRRSRRVYVTAGEGKCHSKNSPDRSGWSSAAPVPFYYEVEE